jgi:hypothetical protein
MSGSYEDKMEKAKQLSPQFQELEASFFDICYEYGEERSAKAQYDENRRIYQGIRQRLLDPKLSPPMSAAPSAPATPAPIASTIKPVPKRVAGIILYVDTNKNNKDREIMFNYSIHRISDGAKIAGIGAGGGEVWPRPSLRHFKIPIDTNNRFAYADRGGYRLHIQYECWSGDPNWIGRVRADAEVEGGEIIPILSETDDFEMGHHDDGKQRERINRDFDFNK